MEANMKNGEFRIRRITATDHGCEYVTHQLVGYLNGERIRKKFKGGREGQRVAERVRL